MLLGAAHDAANLVMVARTAIEQWPIDPTSESWRRSAITALDRVFTLHRMIMRGVRPGSGPVRIDPNPHVRESVALASVLGRAHVDVRTSLRARSTIVADPAELERVVFNLVLNAHQATPDGGWIAVATEDTPPAAITITVSDSGRGKTPEHLHRVQQGVQPSRPDGGGLGLAAVRAMIERAAAHLTIESTPGAGTTVRIRWPAQP